MIPGKEAVEGEEVEVGGGSGEGVTSPSEIVPFHVVHIIQMLPCTSEQDVNDLDDGP